MDFFARRRTSSYVPTQILLSMKFWRLAALLVAVMALSSLAASQATGLKIVTVQTARAGVAFSMTVEAMDANQNVVNNYTGTIQLGSTDTNNPSFVPGPIYTFTPGDAGAHTFQVTLNTQGGQALFATDTAANLNGNTTLNVSANAIPSTTTVSSSGSPSTYGQTVTFTITVTPTNFVTGNVLYFDNGRYAGSGPLTSGQNIAPVNQLSAGNHTITVLYAGDAAYAGSTSNTLNQTVNKANTTTSVPSALQNPASLNQSDQITATVSSSGGIPTGTANFFDGMNQIGNAVPLDQNGNAIFNPSFSTTGNHSIKAVYNGDNNFQGSTSPVLTLPVTSVTFTNISSSPNPSTFGQGVTFTALVSGGTDGVAVTFLDGSNPL